MIAVFLHSEPGIVVGQTSSIQTQQYGHGWQCDSCGTWPNATTTTRCTAAKQSIASIGQGIAPAEKGCEKREFSLVSWHKVCVKMQESYKDSNSYKKTLCS